MQADGRDGDLMRTNLSKAAVFSAALILQGCAAQTGLSTGSTAVVAAPVALENTSNNRIKNLAWNSAMAQACGFYFDNAKLKSSFLAYESQAGTPPESVTKLGASYEKAQGTIRALTASRPEMCTESRLDRIRATMARYLAGDFTPGSAV